MEQMISCGEAQGSKLEEKAERHLFCLIVFFRI